MAKRLSLYAVLGALSLLVVAGAAQATVLAGLNAKGDAPVSGPEVDCTVNSGGAECYVCSPPPGRPGFADPSRGGVGVGWTDDSGTTWGATVKLGEC